MVLKIEDQECDICDGAEAYALHECRPFQELTSGFVSPGAWYFCRRCHTAVVNRDWPSLTQRALREARKLVPPDGDFAARLTGALVTMFILGKTGAWRASDGTHSKEPAQTGRP